MSSELENSGIRVAVSDCSVPERQRWHPPYQTGKTVHVHAKHYKHNEDGPTGQGVCGNGSVPLSHSGERHYENWNTHTHTYFFKNNCGSICSKNYSLHHFQSDDHTCQLFLHFIGEHENNRLFKLNFAQFEIHDNFLGGFSF